MPEDDDQAAVLAAIDEARALFPALRAAVQARLRQDLAHDLAPGAGPARCLTVPAEQLLDGRTLEALRTTLQAAVELLDAVDSLAVPAGEACPTCGQPLLVRWGMRGRFLGCAAFPRCRAVLAATRAYPPVTGIDQTFVEGDVCEFGGRLADLQLQLRVTRGGEVLEVRLGPPATPGPER